MKILRKDYLKVHRYVFVLGLISFLMITFDGAAQGLSEQLQSYNQERIDINKKGMLVLSGWALANMAVGGYGFFKTGGSTKYFHQMNAAWNVVNLTIGAFALQQYLQADPAAFSFSQSIEEAKSMENILLLNIGLDVGYIAAGAFLWERGIRKDNNRLLGYGPSLILQGGFLLVFDAILYGINRSHNVGLFDLLENVNLTAGSLSVTIPL